MNIKLILLGGLLILPSIRPARSAPGDFERELALGWVGLGVNMAVCKPQGLWVNFSPAAKSAAIQNLKMDIPVKPTAEMLIANFPEDQLCSSHELAIQKIERGECDEC